MLSVPVPHLVFFLAPSPRIHKVGLSLVVDHSGKVFKRKGSAAVSLKDVAINKEVAQLETINVFPTIFFFGWWDSALLQVVAATLKASGGRGHFSKHLLAEAVHLFYSNFNLFPNGLPANLPAIEEWSAKNGQAIARLATRFFFPLIILFDLYILLDSHFRQHDFAQQLDDQILARARIFNGFVMS